MPLQVNAKRLIPIEVVGMTANDQERTIGLFEGGVVLKDMCLHDVRSSEIIASMNMITRMWTVKGGRQYKYIFCQVCPEEHMP